MLKKSLNRKYNFVYDLISKVHHQNCIVPLVFLIFKQVFCLELINTHFFVNQTINYKSIIIVFKSELDEEIY